MTFSNLKGHSSITNFQMRFLYGYAAVDKTSTDTARRAVPLRQLNLLLE